MAERAHLKLERELEQLRATALRMGRLAEAILAKSLRAVRDRSITVAEEIKKDDLEIDRLDIAIDKAVLELLALQSPVAHDLRQVIAIKTMAGDLERVGDIARNLAKSASRLANRPAEPLPPILETLADDCCRLLAEAIDSFADSDPDRARAVLAADDQIDEDEDQAIRQAIDRLRQKPEATSQLVDHIFIAKNLERVGDHATNIAEDVILVAESKNVKHAEKLAV